MDWTIILAASGSVVTILGFMCGFLRNFKSEIHSHIDRVEIKIDKLDKRIENLENRLDNQAMRMDNAYRLFEDNMQERK